MNNKYTLEFNEMTGALALCNNGKSMDCPYQPALVMPNNTGTAMNIVRLPCGDNCPLFKFNGSTAVISCGNRGAELIISSVKEKAGKGLVKLN